MATMTAPESDDSVESTTQTDLEDFKKYNVGMKDIKAQNIIELNGEKEIPNIKLYFHQTNTQKVKFGYRFTAPSYIPKCSTNIYTNTMEYLGTTQIAEHQTGDELDIIIGESTIIKCVSTITQIETPMDENTAKIYKLNNTDKMKWYIITEDLNVEIFVEHFGI